jgi:hypothetical protein
MKNYFSRFGREVQPTTFFLVGDRPSCVVRPLNPSYTPPRALGTKTLAFESRNRGCKLLTSFSTLWMLSYIEFCVLLDLHLTAYSIILYRRASQSQPFYE